MVDKISYSPALPSYTSTNYLIWYNQQIMQENYPWKLLFFSTKNKKGTKIKSLIKGTKNKIDEKKNYTD